MNLVSQLKTALQQAIKDVFALELPMEELLINDTKPEFEGEYTYVTFTLTKKVGKKPEEIGELLGKQLLTSGSIVSGYNVIKGFLNLSIKHEIYIDALNEIYRNKSYGVLPKKNYKVLIEYSSPNTNKPLHFGHLRNIFLGAAVSNIFSNNGNDTIKANLINDRGIHICKSMIAWQCFANGATPQSTGIKGDHFVGDYYVKFNDAYKEEIAELQEKGMSAEDAEKNAPILLQAQELLRKWEAGDAETISLWKTMNNWVYEGFHTTYHRMGVSFDKMYYESDTYLLGRDIALKGLELGVMYAKEDGSIWIDLTEDGLDHKLLLRKDGTSVYMTQDIGTAVLKYNDYHMDSSVYVIGDEQNYHMQVLKLIMQKMKQAGADGIYHLSYGMVELPSGRMKSREGTVVDADDMMDEMVSIAKKNTEELGKVDGFSTEELESLYSTLGLGALKFYLLRVDPKKKMIFNPQESIDFHGFTGPFIQYTHARISSILRKYDGSISDASAQINILSAHELGLIKLLASYEDTLLQSEKEYSPAVLCNYLYELAKAFNSFLVDHSILKADNKESQHLRLQLCKSIKHVIAHGMALLGIQVPERM